MKSPTDMLRSQVIRRNRSEVLMAVTLVGMSVAIGLTNTTFFGAENLFEILRQSIVFGMLAVAALIALISGGIDVSFTAIAVFSMYSTTRILQATGYEESILLAFFLAGAIGLGLGLFNALFIDILRLPALIVTLGTLSFFRGLLLTFIGSDYITVLPTAMVSFSRLSLLEGITQRGATYRLPAAFLLLLLTVAVTSFILNRTLVGRGIYALGGSSIGALRAGFNIHFLQFFIYGYIGMISGLAGLIHGSLNRMANPFDLVGMELNVIAAVVLGGARLKGGYGTVLGTLLGVGLIVVINNSLILVGLSSNWHKVAIGLLILIGTGFTAYEREKGVKQ